jgi:hypothetical protein
MSMIAWLRAKEAAEPGWAERVWNTVGRRCDLAADTEVAQKITQSTALSPEPRTITAGMWKDFRIELGLVSKHRRPKGGEPILFPREDLAELMDPEPEPSPHHACDLGELLRELRDLTSELRMLNVAIIAGKGIQLKKPLYDEVAP